MVDLLIHRTRFPTWLKICSFVESVHSEAKKLELKENDSIQMVTFPRLNHRKLTL
jgi:hypothetical protein